MNELKTKIALIYDYGMHVELAITLSKSFKKVLYYCEWKDSFPTSNKYMIGRGFDEFERVTDFFSHIDEADIIIFPDTYNGDLQCYLEKQGKLVWGSRMGEEMELDREAMSKHMTSLGLYVSPYSIITGIESLRKYLQKNYDVYVKCSTLRGDFESFHSPNYDFIKPAIDELEQELGEVMSDIKEFFIQQAYNDAIETGCDLYTINGQYPNKTLAGIEVKDLGYIGKIQRYSNLPEEITDFNTKISPTLKAYGYKGFLSTEIRVSEHKPPFMLDLCCRAGSPPSELYQIMYKNLAEIIYYGSQGMMIDPEYDFKFGVQVVIKSHRAEKLWQNIDFPKKYRNNIKLHNACVNKGKYYICPQTVGIAEIGAIVTQSDNLEDAINRARVISESISGYGIKCEVGSINTAMEQFKQLKEKGVKII